MEIYAFIPPEELFLCDFMMGLGKPKLSTKFEVASFSRCRNIKGKTHMSCGVPLAQGHAHPFFCA